MQAIDWYIECWTKKYFRFSGRARRKEFWMFVLFNALVSVVARGAAQAAPALAALPVLYSAAACVPQLAVTVRRLHDIGRSGWWAALPNAAFALAFLLPCAATSVLLMAATVAMLCWLVRPGVAGPNAYGSDPKSGDRPTPSPGL